MACCEPNCSLCYSPDPLPADPCAACEAKLASMDAAFNAARDETTRALRVRDGARADRDFFLAERDKMKAELDYLRACIGLLVAATTH